MLQDGALFYKMSGLGALPLALFNGVPLSPDEMDPDELETVILQRIMDTTSSLQRAVFMVRQKEIPWFYPAYHSYCTAHKCASVTVDLQGQFMSYENNLCFTH